MASRRPSKKSTRGKRDVTFTNPQKVYFPGTGMTKGEVIRYYIDVAPWMVPHLRDRPVTLIRFPDGVGGKSFYEKNAPGFTPDWVQRFQVPRRRHEGLIDYILINDVETLAWCANLGAIEFHPFLHRVPDLDRPTHLAFDLDPGEGANLLTCIEVAFHLRRLFEHLGLAAYPKVSGSKGLQLYVPLNTPVTYDVTQPFAKAVAEAMEKQYPQLVVSNMTKTLRKKRVLIDWSQNSQAKTTVAVYALRGKRPEPYVSMPVSWLELEAAAKKQDLDALFFTPAEALRRLEEEGDLFAPVLTSKQKLPEAAFNGEDPPPSPAGKKARSRNSLRTYAAKRDFSKTAEPPPRPTRSRQGSRRRFVIQKHAASHLHYDFRLEMEDTLKSWAVPKGLPCALEEKRSAFETEDHPLEYLDFEGTIPAGQYGGGTVMVWDLGTYDVIEGNYWKGSLRVHLSGRKLRGEWHLYRIRRDENGRNTWLLEKRGQTHRAIGAKRDDASVLTGRTMAQIAADNDRQWQSNRNTSGADAAPVEDAAATTTEAPAPAPKKRRAGRSPRPAASRSAPELTFIEPMAAKLVDELPDGPDWLFEVKWDGYRALALKEGDSVRLLSRRNNSLAEAFPEVVEAVRQVPAERLILDGEVVALDASGRPSFQALQHGSSAQEVTIVFYAFDLLHLNGENLMARPLGERKERLTPLLAGTPVLFSAELPGRAQEVVAAVARLGLEGVIAKRRDAPYEAGERSGLWRKRRIALEQEFVVGGFKPNGRTFESLLVGTYEDGRLIYAGKVRAGLDPRSRKAVAARLVPLATAKCPFANLPEPKSGRWGEGITAADMAGLKWVKPEQVVQVGFVEWTRQGHLRHASFRGLRSDKPPREVAREDTAA